MIGHSPNVARAFESPSPMMGWRQRLFNWLARWEEAAIARSLGLPVDRVYFVELSGDDD